MVEARPSTAAGAPQSDVPISPRSTSPALGVSKPQMEPSFGDVSPMDTPCNSPRPTVLTASSSSAARPERNVSIANDPNYPPDVRHNPATDHRRRALSATHDAVVPNSLQGTSSNRTSRPAVGHRRNVSSISDLAHSLRHSTRNSASLPGTETPSLEDLATLANILTSIMSYSSETTAVNSERNSSNASSEESFARSADINANDLEGLRDVVAAARPGVHIRINVYTGGPPLGRMAGAGAPVRSVEDGMVDSAQVDISSSFAKITLTNSITDERPNHDSSETEFLLQSKWLHVFIGIWNAIISEFRVEKAQLKWLVNELYHSFASIFEIALMGTAVFVTVLTLYRGACFLASALEHMFPTYWTGTKHDVNSGSRDSMSPNLAATIFQQPAPSCKRSPVQAGFVYTTEVVTGLFCFAVFVVGIFGWLTVKSIHNNDKEQEKARLQQEMRRAATELELRKLGQRRAKGKGKGKEKVEEEPETSQLNPGPL
ncbi:hypothetical protein BDU57DRAFT_305124 [Ampelomyces quisqualis]|uniref:Uncharacterized protein n=1 Tax=Ampelomyces quisqualis TaxID=50730 RepID=A0A6A5QIZ9_AMPQU|nr:hypothetical protein BDU57DRAFT_305124 [Ampelomyces quisqualis]